MKTLFRRRKYFIDKDAQNRFIKAFSMACLASGVFTVAYFIYSARKAIETTLYSMRLPDVRIGHLLVNEMILTVGIGMLFVLIFFYYTSGKVFSRIEKPLKKMAEFIQNIRNGNLKEEVKLSKNDDFKYLAEELNGLVHEMNQKVTLIRSSADQIIEICDGSRKDPESVNIQQVADHVEGIKKELRRVSC